MIQSFTPKRQITKVKGSEISSVLDHITEEEPLDISISVPSARPKIFNKTISITMRTPGADLELALGFLFTEGIIRNMSQLLNSYPADNKINLELSLEDDVDLSRLDRHFYTSSSCGVCGKASIEALKTFVPSSDKPALIVPRGILKTLPLALRKEQKQFAATGGIHAAALYTTQGQIILLKEDVGRHNALDKLIGASLLDPNISTNDHILLLSGRISFELVHKAAVAGIRCIAAIGAPSTLAIETAEEYDITLVGFLKSDSFNIYNGANNIS